MCNFKTSLLSFILLALLSCSSDKKKSSILGDVEIYKSNDYAEHLASLTDAYMLLEKKETLKLSLGSIDYLQGVYNRIIENNQVLLSKSNSPKFFVIKHGSPFFFSLPKSQFFLSTALIEKYLKSEELFVAAFCAEVVRSVRNIYEKKITYPLGFSSTEEIVALSRIRPEMKKQVNEWVYHVLKRSGFDPSAYLNWIQIQNRNIVDFSYMLGDFANVSKEEHLFKNYMAKQGVLGVEKKLNESNSSNEFYKFLSNVNLSTTKANQK